MMETEDTPENVDNTEEARNAPLPDSDEKMTDEENMEEDPGNPATSEKTNDDTDQRRDDSSDNTTDDSEDENDLDDKDLGTEEVTKKQECIEECEKMYFLNLSLIHI